MMQFQSMKKAVSCMVAVIFFYLSIIVVPAHATLVSTSDILSTQENQKARQKVMLFLDRQDVARYLHTFGVDIKEAKTRVKTMTAEEINLLSQKIDQMPAGGDAFGFIVGVAFVAFVVLIITDIIGVTDVFTFIKKR